MNGNKKEMKRVLKYKCKRKKKHKGFHGFKPDNVAGSSTEHVEEIHTEPGVIVPTSEENIVELHKTISFL